MPTRRTSPRRSMTRPTVPFTTYERDVDDLDPAPAGSGGALARAAPWLALGALAIALAALAAVFLGRGNSLDPCRRAAWAAVPATSDLPTGWNLSSTDLNANGMTVSIAGPTSPDNSTDQPIVYASVTCYGDVAQTAMSQYRSAAQTAGATVTTRGLGDDAYDVKSKSSGSVTTLFRVGGLIGQVANAGSTDPADLATITEAVASAMGDATAAGSGGAAAASNGAPTGSGGQPGGSPEVGASQAPGAPELEAHLPTDIAGTQLTVQSGTAADGLGGDPASQALAASLPRLGIKLTDLQVAHAFDESQTLDLDLFGFRLAAGGDVAKLRTAIINTWLSGAVPGVKQSSVTLGGKTFTKIDFGLGGRTDYVYRGKDYLIVIETGDAGVATEVASSLK